MTAQIVNMTNAQEVPSKEIFRTLNVIVTKSFIQACHQTAVVKFFVDHINGEAYGSYDSIDDAKLLACEMQKLLEA